MALILTKAQSAGGSGSSITGLAVNIINGQPTLTLEDTTRGNKKLSVAEQVLIYSEATLADLDWLDIGDAVDSDSGFIANFDGTLVYASAHCEDTGANSKNIHLFINAVDNGSLGALAGGLNATFNNNILNIDFAQGDRIRLRAVNGAGGAIQDTVVRLTIKWRAP